TSELPAGVYILKTTNGQHNVQKKFVKK
ncbi:MAG: hypothetical protein C0490_24370, partial [Marivirga sp.]|nr:hypothetical protein [Marivirga sp.]